MRPISSRYLPLMLLVTGCVSAAKTDAANTTNHVTVTVTADGESKLMPRNAVSPGFSQLTVDLMTVDAVAGSANDITPGGAASLGQIPMQTASPSCELTGCQFHVSNVAINGQLQGLMSVVSDARTAVPKVWYTTYATVINQNQIVDTAKAGGPVSAFAPAFALSNSTITQLAKLLNTDGNTLVSRGVCLGLVWSTRGEGTGMGMPYPGARIGLTSATGTPPSLYYLNDAMDTVTTLGTNQDGLFVLVGADPTLATFLPPGSLAVGLSIENAVSAGTFESPICIVRPGIVTVMPIIPRRP